jgi:hypothetical protein
MTPDDTKQKAGSQLAAGSLSWQLVSGNDSQPVVD